MNTVVRRLKKEAPLTAAPGRLAWALLPLLAASAGAQEAERRAILERVGPSVVGIRNDECYGSGIILDEQGTILTNAHVIASPLPHRVEVQGRQDGQLRTLWFRKVVLIGVHPVRDLAIIRIDPSENQATLTPLPLSKSKAITHDLVHAIGFPNTRGGTVKVCTSGEVTGVDRFVDMPGYFEFSAEIHPGNSGGPLVDASGTAIGIVTAAQFNGERVAWAIPLFDLRPDQFIPMERRPKNPANAYRILRRAEEELKKARGGRLFSAVMAGEFFQLALVEDISNPDIYFKIGTIERAFEEYSTAAAYLVRSLQLDPWGGENKEAVYHDLGIALYEIKRPADATLVWTEGIAKFPDSCGRIWDDLAVRDFDEAKFLDAACATRASLRAFGPRPEKMNTLYDQCRKRLDPPAIARLTAYENSIDSLVDQGRKAVKQAQAGGRRYLSPACEAFINSYGGVQREASNFNFSTLGGGPNAPKPLDIPDAQLVPLLIRSRIAVAAEHLEGGRIKLAQEVLEDVIKTYPERPEVEAARELLSLIKKTR